MKKRFTRFAPQHCFFRKDDKDPESSSGGGSSVPPRENPADALSRFGGDAVRIASRVTEVEHDNFGYREKLRLRDAEIAELKGRVPAEGAVILTGDAAKDYPEYVKLGTVKDVSNAIESGKVAQGKVSESERQGALEKAAKVAGFKPDLLKALGKDLTVRVNEVEQTGTEGKVSKVERAFVVTKNGETEVLTPLADHFKAQGETVLQSLLHDSSGSHGSQQNESQQQGSGFQYPAQQGGTGTGGNQQKSASTRIVASRYGHNVPKKEG